jgi:hypothetical protein
MITDSYSIFEKGLVVMAEQAVAGIKIDFEAIIRMAFKMPGVKVDRERFLRRELKRYFGPSIAEKAVNTNPAQAGINVELLQQVAKASVNREVITVTALSTAAGMPGGLFMAATIPLDVAQYFAHILIIVQKLAYIYGWPEMGESDGDEIDDETFNQLILMLGVMFGVKGAHAAIAKIAGLAAANAEKKLLQAALTKGTIFPFIKRICGVLGYKLYVGGFAKGVGKAIPIVGGIFSGAITFASITPMIRKFQKHLITLPTASVDFYKEEKYEDIYSDVVDIDFSEIAVDIDESDKTDVSEAEE